MASGEAMRGQGGDTPSCIKQTFRAVFSSQELLQLLLHAKFIGVSAHLGTAIV